MNAAEAPDLARLWREPDRAGVDEFLAAAPEITACLDANDLWFLRSCFSTPFDYYLARLRAVGLAGHGTVLDAACGFGQWSLALTQLNNQVVGLDVSRNRLRVLAGLAAWFGRQGGLALAQGDMTSLPLADSSCDAVLCYGALMFCDERQVLAEFGRVLRPGGLVYAVSSGLGLYLDYLLHRWWARRTSFYLRNGLKCMGNGLLGRRHRPHFTTESRIRAAAAKAGLEVTHFQPEGTAAPQAPAPKPIYKGRYFGALGVFDVLARKPEAAIGEGGP